MPLPAVAQKDTTLQQRLAYMVEEDQAGRLYLDTIRKNYGFPSAQNDSMWKVIHAIDHKHNAVLKGVIRDLKSYPDEKLVGYTASHNFWLLVQHQDRDTTFQKEVLHLMKYAVEYKAASATDYAYLTDRVMLNTGKKQVYGTQFWLLDEKDGVVPRPMEDSLNVDKRRAEVGLGPISEAIEQMNRRYNNSYNYPKKE